MNKVFFKPWIGKDFHTHGHMGKKILVLGESHYCEIEKVCDECGTTGSKPGCKEFTNGTVQAFLQYKKTGQSHSGWMNTYTKFGNVLANRKLDGIETENFWHAVAFYNFVQIAVVDKRTPPSPANFRFSDTAFFDVLSSLRPDVVIAWGERLWNNLPSAGQGVQIDDLTYHVYTLADGTHIPLFYVYHPSSYRFNYGAHGEIARAISRSKEAVMQIS